MCGLAIFCGWPFNWYEAGCPLSELGETCAKGTAERLSIGCVCPLGRLKMGTFSTGCPVNKFGRLSRESDGHPILINFVLPTGEPGTRPGRFL